MESRCASRVTPGKMVYRGVLSWRHRSTGKMCGRQNGLLDGVIFLLGDRALGHVSLWVRAHRTEIGVGR